MVHALRVLLVAALLLAIPSPDPMPRDGAAPPTLEQLRDAGHRIELGWSLADRDPSSGLWQLRDATGEPMGWVARSFPDAREVVGYRGPTEASVVLDPDLVITSVGLLGSDDTSEHVDAVRKELTFFEQFRGWKWREPPNDLRVDAVSGATLTSLALAEGVIRRMGGSRPSLVFPEALDVREVRSWYPEAASVDPLSGDVADSQGRRLGRVLRTGPYSDDRIGYQGPTELLLQLTSENVIESIQIRRSLDNEPYVDYVRTEAGFWKIFKGMSLDELADFQPQEQGVEGVSGATMTSQTVADTLVAAAQTHRSEAARGDQPEPHWIATVRWSASDIATGLILIMAGLTSRMGWLRHAWSRRLWLLTVVMVVGLWAGNLVSLALVAGWSAEGIAWRLAPGLTAVVLVAMLMPPLTKKNPYCNHLCPHGAVQQLIKPGRLSRRRRRLSQLLSRYLTHLPGLTLVVAYLTLLVYPAVDLSSWEPFHAYLFAIASWGSIGLAIVSLVLSAILPMGYCRLGCPTGRLIDYLRLSAASGRMGRSDVVAIALLVIATLTRFQLIP